MDSPQLRTDRVFGSETTKKLFEKVPGEFSVRNLLASREIKVSKFVFPALLEEGPLAPPADNFILAAHCFEPHAFANIESEFDGAKPVKHVLRDKELLICPPGVSIKHSWKGFNASVFQNIGTLISPNHIRRVCIEQFDQDPSLLEFPAAIGVQNELLAHLIFRLGAEVEEGNPSGHVYLDELSNAVVAELVRSCPTRTQKKWIPKGGLSPFVLKKVLDYIHTFFADKDLLRVPLIAREAGLSESHFIRMFKVSMQVSPSLYIANHRVEIAQKLILEKDYSLTEIAMRVGYESYAGFHKHFVKVTGQTPQRFKQENKRMV